MKNPFLYNFIISLLMKVEEINKFYNRDVYFTSSVNLLSKSKVVKNNDSRRKRLTPGSYNLSLLENQLHGTELTEDLIEEKNSNKRLLEIDTENFNENSRIDLPKTGIDFQYQKSRTLVSLSSKTNNSDIKIKQSYLTSVRKILSSRRTYNNYMDEMNEKFHSILYGLISKRTRNFIVPNKKLCSICGDSSPGSCVKCGSRICSVKCSTIHNETRCTGY